MSGRQGKVKNKQAATVQITAEQILREATERRERTKPQPQQHIADQEELDDYRLRKRKGFEDYIRANRTSISSWLKYAQWEENQLQLERARSIFERALQVDSRNQVLWLKYAELEMKNKNVNHARNVFDRAVGILPRIDMFWYKYAYMEEMLDNIQGSRTIFERWMKWEPAEDSWMAYVKFEQRYKEIENARNVFQRFVNTHPSPKNWIKWSKFEENLGNIDRARLIYEQCGQTIGDHFLDQNVFVSFSKFEVRQKEFERARVIYKYALEKLPKGETENLYNSYTQFEKQFGGKEGIEDVVTNKRRIKYENEITVNPKNYDIWFDFARLEESVGDHTKIREVYERALAQVPPILEKRLWRRYIYIWLFYAAWEESVAKDIDRAKQIYLKCIELIPHKSFTFAKVWLFYAKFLIRRLDLQQARKTLGRALGVCPKQKLFKGYIDLELALREFDRVRQLYEKYLEFNPGNCLGWIRYTELERTTADFDRARGIFEIAIEQDTLDMPEVLWKSFIDFESEQEEWEKARQLYERLLQKTQHVKVWISFAMFEVNCLSNGDTPSKRMVKSRDVFQRGYKNLKEGSLDGGGNKEERAILLESWKDAEVEFGEDEEALEKVQKMMPRAVKKRRKLEDDNVWEEYYDYIFPDDEVDKPNFKLLAMAHEWKSKMANEESEEEDESSEDEEEDDE